MLSSPISLTLTQPSLHTCLPAEDLPDAVDEPRCLPCSEPSHPWPSSTFQWSLSPASRELWLGPFRGYLKTLRPHRHQLETVLLGAMTLYPGFSLFCSGKAEQRASRAGSPEASAAGRALPCCAGPCARGPEERPSALLSRGPALGSKASATATWWSPVPMPVWGWMRPVALPRPRKVGEKMGSWEGHPTAL